MEDLSNTLPLLFPNSFQRLSETDIWHRLFAHQTIPRTQAQTMAVIMDGMHLSSPALLEKIDKLRDLNVGREVALPQVRMR